MWQHDFTDLKDTIEKHAEKEELMLMYIKSLFCKFSRTSITHSTTPQLIREKGEQFSTVYNLSFPFDWQMITDLKQGNLCFCEYKRLIVK